MHRDILLVIVSDTCTLVSLLRSWFSVDRIIWKFHIIIWRKFRYFEMEWYPKIFSVSGNFGSYILCLFARYMHETLCGGDLSHCPKLAHSHYIKKKSKWRAGRFAHMNIIQSLGGIWTHGQCTDMAVELICFLGTLGLLNQTTNLGWIPVGYMDFVSHPNTM